MIDKPLKHFVCSQHLEYEEVNDQVQISNSELSNRVKHRSKNRFSKHFIVQKGRFSVAFLSLDIRPHTDYLVLYELYVLSKYRNLGVGTKILSYVCDMAKSQGFKRIILTAKPIDPSISVERLACWYNKRGVVKSAEYINEFEKVV